MSPIPTPWTNRVRHWVTNHLQMTLFGVTALMVVLLWYQRSPRVIVLGQVEIARTVVPASRDGMLQWIEPTAARFDRVERGVTPIARYDISEAILTMESLTAERKQLDAELAAERERLRSERVRWRWESDQRRRQLEQQTLDRIRARLASRQQLNALRSELGDVQQRQRDWKIEVQKNDARLAQLSLQIESTQAQRERLQQLVKLRMSSQDRMKELESALRIEREQLSGAKQLANILKAQGLELVQEIESARIRLTDAERTRSEMRLEPAASTNPAEDVSAPPAVNESVVLEPYRQSIAVQDAKIRALADVIASNEIVAPISGQIAEVHRSPGTFVRSGDPLVTINASKPRFIVAYLDRPDQISRAAGASVQIRVDGRAPIRAESTIAEFGNQFEVVPRQLRRNANQDQWGIPIKVAVPSSLAVVPGQAVQLVIQ